MLKFAIIISSIRTGRFADKPTKWFKDIADQRTDATFEVLDLRDYPIPLLDEAAPTPQVPNNNAVAVRWQQKLAEFDGFVFITAEYNHGPTAALKNALDSASTPWNKKPAAFVGYGSVGAARAIEQVRTVAIELQMAPTHTGVFIQGADFMGAWQRGAALEDMAHLQPGVKAMLDELVWWGQALKTARAADAQPVTA